MSKEGMAMIQWSWSLALTPAPLFASSHFLPSYCPTLLLVIWQVRGPLALYSWMPRVPVLMLDAGLQTPEIGARVP